jgi:hypothetical protein
MDMSRFVKETPIVIFVYILEFTLIVVFVGFLLDIEFSKLFKLKTSLLILAAAIISTVVNFLASCLMSEEEDDGSPYK